METKVPLCAAGCRLIFLSGFGYSQKTFEESCEEFVREIKETNKQGKTVPIEEEIAEGIENALKLILKRLQNGLCDDGVTCAVICFEEGVEHIQNSLGNLPKTVADAVRKNVAIFAIHSGSYYKGITEDLAKIAVNIDLANDGSPEGKIDIGKRDGKSTKKIHLPSKENPYVLKNCVQNPDVKKFIMNCLNLHGDTTGFCKTHGQKAEEVAPVDKGSASSSSAPAQMEPDPRASQPAKEHREFHEEQIIGRDGGEIMVAGCGVRFPAGAVRKETEFHISVEHRVHPSTAGDIQVTPVLRCLPSMEFDIPVQVKIQARCHDRSDNVMAHVMTQENDSSPTPFADIPLKSDGVIEFECYHFTWFWAYIKSLLFGKTEFIIQPTLYISKREGNFCISLQAENTPEHPENPEFHKASVMLNKFLLPAQEEIPVSLRCENPEGLRILPHDNQVFVACENFAKVGLQHIAFTIQPKPPAREMLTLLCRIDGHEMRFDQQFPELPTNEPPIGTLITGNVGSLFA